MAGFSGQDLHPEESLRDNLAETRAGQRAHGGSSMGEKRRMAEQTLVRTD